MRDDVGGEELELIERVGLAEIVGLELAEVSGAVAVGGGLNLDSYDTVAEAQGYIEGRRVAKSLPRALGLCSRGGWLRR